LDPYDALIFAMNAVQTVEEYITRDDEFFHFIIAIKQVTMHTESELNSNVYGGSEGIVDQSF
jgi:hypothetical protein